MEKEVKKLFKKTKETLNKAKRSYVCKSLKDVIRGFRECKTVAEERALVKKESAHIRDLFKEGDTAFRRRNVLKLLFFHMNGHPTDFGQIECLKLCASHKYMDKRVGYLGMLVLLTDSEDTLTLITNCLKLDLENNDPTIVALALTALGDVTSPEMLRDLEGVIQKHLTSKISFVVKKAALAATQVVRKLPDSAELFIGKVPNLLEHRESAVLLSGLALATEIGVQAPNFLPQLRRNCASSLVKIMKNIFSHSYDTVVIGGVPEPFVQGRVLILMRILGEGDSQVSEKFGETLALVASSTDTAKGAGNAVLYECVKTLIALPLDSSMKNLALRLLENFLETKEPNIRYVALQELKKVVAYDIIGVQALQSTIFDCMKEEDVSICRRAVDVAFTMTNQRNVQDLAKELIMFLDKRPDPDLQEDACRKICTICNAFSPSSDWHVRTMIDALRRADRNMPEDLCMSIVSLVSGEPSLQEKIASEIYVEAIAPELPIDLRKARWRLIRIALILVGEHGHYVIGSGKPFSFPTALSSMSQILNACANLYFDDENEELQVEIERVRENALTAMVTMAARVATDTEMLELRNILEEYRSSPNVELQTRACEYSVLLTSDMLDIRQELFAPIPSLNFDRFRTSHGLLAAGGSSTVSSIDQIDALFGFSSLSTAAPTTSVLAITDGTGLDDLLGGLSLSTNANQLALVPK
uniref:AP-1 complex subunit gamma n=1 Tax=Compsopogon caeruleus TaxID=31354 RepID=A0A7S1TBZ6_9RHOD|mmetsp:Transcript_16281/g.33030  ORF Transcript_16281/g.33030 Transcript_16281/m.33030 type:complete len:701 (+) Transcript_16281:70-2172(+)